MSQTKAQLIEPVGVVTASGIVVSGVATAASFDGDIVGSASSVIQGKNLNLGALNAVSFAGDFTGNATGIITSSAIKVGQLTASSFVGDFTGTATSMFKGTGFIAGTVNSQGFVADVTGNVTGDVTGNIAGNITGNVTGNAVGAAGSVLSGSNIHVGVMTATSYYGDGSNLTGIAATNFNTQTVTANSATTSIDLSAGNVITFNKSSDTTVSLANTSEAMDITLIIPGADYTITWPSRIKWDGGVAPTTTATGSGEVSQYQLLTRDSGVTWYGRENMDQSFAEKYTLWAWGKNQNGMLGLNEGALKGYSSPTQIPGSWTATVSGTYGAAFAVRSNGTLWAWGSNPSGVLGQGLANEGPDPKLANASSPVQISGDWSDCKFPKYSMGDQSTEGIGVIKSDGTMWVWGNNGSGLLGLNETSDGSLRYSSPVQLGTDTTWRSFDMGSTSVLATKTDGTLWSWGQMGHYGNLGHNQRNSDLDGYSSPTQIGNGTDWSEEIGYMKYGGGAVKTDGTLWMWGYNYYGQLGVNSAASSVYGLSSPTQVPGTDWEKVSRSINCTYAIKTDGTLMGWGDNEVRGLGIPSVTARSSPVAIPGATWLRVWPGRVESPRGLGQSNDLYGWGSNVWGSIGDNTNDAASATGVAARTQVPGTWTGMWHGGDLVTFGLKSS